MRKNLITILLILMTIGASAQNQRYATPLARAAAIAAQGHARGIAHESAHPTAQNAAAPRETASMPIKLTLSAGEKPCINARLPRGMGLLEGMEKVLEAYKKTQKT